MTVPCPGVVDAAAFARALAVAEAGVRDPLAGLFGPDSTSWLVNRESLVFLGASRAALLQIAHPGVAASIDQHSNVTAHPLRRFRGTFTTVYRMVFGTAAQALDAARRLRSVHERIAGRDERGTPYRANDRDGLRWVYATLIDSALLMHERVLAPLPPPARARYYEESKRFAHLFGLTDADLPGDWRAFERYFADYGEGLEVSDAARRLAPFLLEGERRGRPNLPMPAWYSALTVATLPPSLREQFAFRHDAADAERAAAAVARVRRVYPRLPRMLRYVPPYREATLRLAGRRHPPVSVRVLNRIWFGRARLVS